MKNELLETFNHFHFASLQVALSNWQYVTGYVVVAALISFAILYRMAPPTNERTLNLIQWTIQLVGVACIFLSFPMREVGVASVVGALLLYNFVGWSVCVCVCVCVCESYIYTVCTCVDTCKCVCVLLRKCCHRCSIVFYPLVLLYRILSCLLAPLLAPFSCLLGPLCRCLSLFKRWSTPTRRLLTQQVCQEIMHK